MFMGLYSYSPLFASGLYFQKEAPHWPWPQNRKHCHGTTSTRRCFSFKPRASCCSWNQIAFSFRLDCVYACTLVYVCLPPSKPACISVCSLKSVQNCWQVPIPLSGKSLQAYTVNWSPSCCARLASLKMWQVFSLLSATNAICGATL